MPGVPHPARAAISPARHRSLDPTHHGKTVKKAARTFVQVRGGQAAGSSVRRFSAPPCWETTIETAFTGPEGTCPPDRAAQELLRLDPGTLVLRDSGCRPLWSFRVTSP